MGEIFNILKNSYIVYLIDVNKIKSKAFIIFYQVKLDY